MSRLTSSFTCQLISTIITTLVIHYSFTLSLQAQNLPFQQILPTLDFFYFLHQSHSDQIVTYRHQDYNPDRAQKLISSSMFRPDCLYDNGTGPDLSHSSFYF